MNPAKLITIFCIIIIAFSCNKAPFIPDSGNTPGKISCVTHTQIPQAQYLSNQAIPVAPVPTSSCDMLPLDNNNYWIYRDSSFNRFGQLTFTRIDSVYYQRSYLTNDNIVFWEKGAFDTTAFTLQFMSGVYSTDSAVYFAKTSMLPSSTFTVKEYYYLTSDSVRETNFIINDYQWGPRILKRNQVVKTAAGTFTNAIMVQFRTIPILSMEYIEFFVPGIGIVKREQKSYTVLPPNPVLSTHSRRELIRYKID